MVRIIKFDLKCDGHAIKTLEELQEHFSIDDMLDYYNNPDKTLHRWLKSRGYDNELAQMEAITSTETADIIKDLCKVFNIPIDDNDIKAYLSEVESRNNQSTQEEQPNPTNKLEQKPLSDREYRFRDFLELLKSTNPKDRRYAMLNLVRDYMPELEKEIIYNPSDNIGMMVEILCNPDTRKLLLDERWNYEMKEGDEEKFKKYGIKLIVEKRKHSINSFFKELSRNEAFCGTRHLIILNMYNIYIEEERIDTNSLIGRVIDSNALTCFTFGLKNEFIESNFSLILIVVEDRFLY